MFSEEKITMAELNRYEIIRCLLDKRITNREAARSLELSVRQIQRIKKKVTAEGVREIFHGNKGRKPVHAFSSKLKEEFAVARKARCFFWMVRHIIGLETFQRH